jgi:hypothetical protein
MNFLPGWNPSFLMGSRLSSITQFATATSAGSATITAPANILAGDLIVMIDSGSGGISGIAPTAVTPTGFTAISTSITTGAYRACFSYKLAVGTEGGTSITGMAPSGGGGMAKIMMVFRGNKPATTLTVGSPAGQATTGNPTAQNCTAGSGVAPLVVLGAYGAWAGLSGLVNPRTFSTTKDAEQEITHNAMTDDHDLWLAYKIYNSAPADSSIDMDDEGTNVLMSAYIQMAA